MSRSRYDRATILDMHMSSAHPEVRRGSYFFFQFCLLAEWVRWTRLGVYDGPSSTFTRCPELCGKKPKDLIRMDWSLVCPSISYMHLSLVSNVALASSTIVPTSTFCLVDLFCGRAMEMVVVT